MTLRFLDLLCKELGGHFRNFFLSRVDVLAAQVSHEFLLSSIIVLECRKVLLSHAGSGRLPRAHGVPVITLFALLLFHNFHDKVTKLSLFQPFRKRCYNIAIVVIFASNLPIRDGPFLNSEGRCIQRHLRVKLALRVSELLD